MFARLPANEFIMHLFGEITAQIPRNQVLDALSVVQCRVMWERGLNDGHAAGTWFFDGNTSEETYRAILKGIEDGDPAILDQLPTPRINGEWVDDPDWDDIVAEELAVDLERIDSDADDWLEAYEAGFQQGSQHEIERVAHYHISAWNLERLAESAGIDEDD